jgi:hypothetical protein
LGALLNAALSAMATVPPFSREEEAEIRDLLALMGCGQDHPDHAEALAGARANPRVHLEGLRESARLEGLTK